jgi:hypothetical protein
MTPPESILKGILKGYNFGLPEKADIKQVVNSKYRVFDIESESRSPPRVMTNDQHFKKLHICSLLLVEIHLLFSVPVQIRA